jgi:hypothetical protein
MQKYLAMDKTGKVYLAVSLHSSWELYTDTNVEVF